MYKVVSGQWRYFPSFNLMMEASDHIHAPTTLSPVKRPKDPRDRKLDGSGCDKEGKLPPVSGIEPGLLTSSHDSL